MRVKPLFTYFANKYSKDLGEKVRRGIKRKKEIGKYTGGRPKKEVDVKEIKHLRKAGLSYRAISNEINKFLQKKEKISYITIKRTLQKS